MACRSTTGSTVDGPSRDARPGTQGQGECTPFHRDRAPPRRLESQCRPWRRRTSRWSSTSAPKAASMRRLRNWCRGPELESTRWSDSSVAAARLRGPGPRAGGVIIAVASSRFRVRAGEAGVENEREGSDRGRPKWRLATDVVSKPCRSVATKRLIVARRRSSWGWGPGSRSRCRREREPSVVVVDEPLIRGAADEVAAERCGSMWRRDDQPVEDREGLEGERRAWPAPCCATAPRTCRAAPGPTGSDRSQDAPLSSTVPL